MSRHRAYSDPASPTASPSTSSSTRLPQYASLLHQTHQISLNERPERVRYDYTYEDEYDFQPYTAPRPPALTEASLAALSRPGPTAERQRYPYPYNFSNNPYPTIGSYGYIPRPSATPSTTSVSDEEDEAEGYEEKNEEREVILSWLDRKGKGKARELGQGVRVERKVVEEGKGMAGSLPEEVLMHIFRLMPTRNLLSAMLVSRTWCLSAFPLLYARPSITSTGQLAALCRILSAPPESLSLPYHTQIRRMNFNHIAKVLPSDMFIPLRVCTRMERITMAGCKRVSASALRTVLDCMPGLVALDMAGSDMVDDSVLKVLGTRCPRLQGLHLNGCKGVGDAGVKAIAKGCRMLRRVKIADCHRITDESIIHLMRLCPLILELDIASLPQLRDTSLYAIWLNCIHLREFNPSKNVNFTSAGIPDLPQLFHNEPNDSLVKRSNPGWVVFLEKHPEISHLAREAREFRQSQDSWEKQEFRDVGGILRPRAMTVDSYVGTGDRERKLDLALLRPLAPTFDVLRTVDFSGCTELDDLALANMVKSAPKLRKLSLAKCSKLTDRGMESVARLGKQLHHLHLGHLFRITDAAITIIARSCTRLRYFDVAGCTLLTDLSVFELSANLPRLRRIGLVKVVNLTDHAIEALAERHTALEKLHLSYCEDISVRAIAFLLNRLLNLSHLSLTGVKAFRNPELQKFRKEVPQAFTEHQAASFCVYSYHGIVALRQYLNAQQLANTAGAGSDTSTRRGSGSSASSLTVPAFGHSPPQDGSVWVGPAYRGGEDGGDRLSSHIAGRWATSPAINARTFEAGDTGAPFRPLFARHSEDRGGSRPTDRLGESSAQLGPRTGDQVYRRVSTPTLPIPPRVAVAGRSVPRPRGPREGGSGIAATFSETRERPAPSRRDEILIPISRMGEDEVQRIPGEYPRAAARNGGTARGGGGEGVWGPEGASGMIWSYGHSDGAAKGSGSCSRDESRERLPHPGSSNSAPPPPVPPISTPSPPPPLGRYRSSTTASRTPPPSSFPAQRTAGSGNRASTGNIYNFRPYPSSTTTPATPPESRAPASTGSTGESISSYLAQGRERGGSVSSALTGLAGRLRSPSLTLPVAVGDVGSPLRWVAEMVGWGGEGDAAEQSRRRDQGGEGREEGDEGPRGESR